MTVSAAPSERGSSSFPGEPAAATTSAPSSLATLTAALPTPPAAACTSTRTPGRTSACRVRGIQAVRNAIRKEAPCSNEAPSGRSKSHSSSTATRSA